MELKIYISHRHGDFARKDDLSALLIKDFQLLWKHSFKATPTIYVSELLSEKEKEQYIKEADAFLIILTPAYAQDTRCQAELQEILQVSQTQLQRVFKIRKTQMVEAEEPVQLQHLISYDFFGLDYELQIFFDFTQGHDFYWECLDDLVEDIGTFLIPTETQKTKEKLYLALTTPDRLKEYQELARDFKNHGFEVLPHVKPPKSKATLKEFMFEQLKDCAFSVHIVGELFGEVLQDGEESIVSYQLELAKAYHGTSPLKRFILLPSKSTITERKQNKVIEYLQFQENVHDNAELVQADIESFKDIIYQFAQNRKA